MDKLIVFLTEWVVDSVVLLLLSVVLSKQIVLGNSTMAGAMSAVICAFIITLVLYFAPFVAKRMDLKFKDERIFIILYVVLLIPFIWIIKKLSLITGMGLSNNLIILVVAFVISVVYFYISKYSVKYLNKL